MNSAKRLISGALSLLMVWSLCVAALPAGAAEAAARFAHLSRPDAETAGLFFCKKDAPENGSAQCAGERHAARTKHIG